MICFICSWWILTHLFQFILLIALFSSASGYRLKQRESLGQGEGHLPRFIAPHPRGLAGFCRAFKTNPRGCPRGRPPGKLMISAIVIAKLQFQFVLNFGGQIKLFMTSSEAWTSEGTDCFDASANSIGVCLILCSFKLFVYHILFHFLPELSNTGQYNTHSNLHFILTASTTWLVISFETNFQWQFFEKSFVIDNFQIRAARLYLSCQLWYYKGPV